MGNKKQNEKKETGNKGFFNKITGAFKNTEHADEGQKLEASHEEYKVKRKPKNSFSAMLEQRKHEASKRNKNISEKARIAMEERKAFESKMSDNAKQQSKAVD